MDMLKEYGPKILAEMTVKDIAARRKHREQDVLGCFKDTFENKKMHWGIGFGGYRR